VAEHVLALNFYISLRDTTLFRLVLDRIRSCSSFVDYTPRWPRSYESLDHSMVEEWINDLINLLDHGYYSIMLVPISNLAYQNIVGILRVEKCSLTSYSLPVP